MHKCSNKMCENDTIETITEIKVETMKSFLKINVCECCLDQYIQCQECKIHAHESSVKDVFIEAEEREFYCTDCYNSSETTASYRDIDNAEFCCKDSKCV